MQHPTTAQTCAVWALVAPLFALAMSCTCEDTTYITRNTTPETNNGDTAACEAPLAAITVGALALNTPYNANITPAALVDQGWIYFHDTVAPEDTLQNSIEVWRVRPGSPKEQLTDNTHPDMLVDAHLGAVLTREGPVSSSPSPPYRAIYTSQDQTQTIAHSNAPTLLGFNSALGTRVRRVALGAVLLNKPRRLQWWSEDSTLHDLAPVDTSYTNHTLGDGRAAWLEYGDEGTHVMLWDSRAPDQPARQITTPDAPPARTALLTSTFAIWSDERGVLVHDLGDGTARIIHEGTSCQLQDTSTTHALFRCLDDATAASRLWRYADGEAPVLVREAPMILSARIHGARVIWAEYDSVDAWCSDGTDGRIMIAVGDAAPEPIAPIGAGCSCCATIWPELALEFDGTTIAWNYRVEDGEPTSQGGIGYALLEFEACAP